MTTHKLWRQVLFDPLKIWRWDPIENIFWDLATFMDRKGNLNCPWSSSMNNSGHFLFCLSIRWGWKYTLNLKNVYWSFVSSGTLLFFCDSFFVAVFFAVDKVWSIRNSTTIFSALYHKRMKYFMVDILFQFSYHRSLKMYI